MRLGTVSMAGRVGGGQRFRGAGEGRWWVDGVGAAIGWGTGRSSGPHNRRIYPSVNDLTVKVNV